jgi:YfiH family protein
LIDAADILQGYDNIVHETRVSYYVIGDKMFKFIQPNWPAPENVHAVTTTRASFNLAHYVGDDRTQILANRRRLRKELNLPSEPVWLDQQHSIEVIDLGQKPVNLSADGSYTNETNTVCAVLTADCLPILLCSENSREIAAIHAGWRGLLNGVIDSGVRRFKSQPGELLAWLGPAISQQAFEVGSEVRDAFLKRGKEAVAAFKPSQKSDHWMADLYQLARQRLHKLGVTKVYGGDFCTYTDHERFYSYRRDNQAGRMATLIWLEKSAE